MKYVSYQKQFATCCSPLYHLPRYTVCVKSPQVSYCLYLTEISWLISNMQILLYMYCLAAAERAWKPKYAVGGGTTVYVYYGQVMFSSVLAFISLCIKMYSVQSVILRKRKCYPSFKQERKEVSCVKSGNFAKDDLHLR